MIMKMARLLIFYACFITSQLAIALSGHGVLVKARNIFQNQSIEQIASRRVKLCPQLLDIYKELAAIDPYVAKWMVAKIIGLEQLDRKDYIEIANFLVHPTIYPILKTLKGKVGIVGEIPGFPQNDGIYYSYFDAAMLISWRPWQGYKVDVALQSSQIPSSAFIHEFVHWITDSLITRYPELLLNKEIFELKLQKLRGDSLSSKSTAVRFFHLHDASLVRLRKGLKKRWKDAETKYLASFREYLAHGVQTFFLDDSSIYLTGVGHLARIKLKREDPELFRNLEVVFHIPQN